MTFEFNDHRETSARLRRMAVVPAEPGPSWWERNRVRAVALSLIALMLVLAIASPWIHR